MSRVEQRNIEWYRSLPKMEFGSVLQIEALYEYSATNPTGVTIGKMWRRLNGSFDQEFLAAGGIPKWVVCRYEEAKPGLRTDGGYHNHRGYLVSNVPPDDQPYPAPEGLRWLQMCATVTYRPVVRKAMERYDGALEGTVLLGAATHR